VRSIALRLMFLVGALLTAVLLFLPIFVLALLRRARAVHPHGTICHAEIVALDDVVGPRLAGEARATCAAPSVYAFARGTVMPSSISGSSAGPEPEPPRPPLHGGAETLYTANLAATFSRSSRTSAS
jgi:hypothetical protein